MTVYNVLLKQSYNRHSVVLSLFKVDIRKEILFYLSNNIHDG